MDKQLGEPIDASEAKKGDLLWHNGGFQMITDVNKKDDAMLIFYFLGGEKLSTKEDDMVMRAGKFLVGRRIN